MPWRIDPTLYPNRAKMQFTTSAAMPNMVYRACVVTGKVSNAQYVQHAVAEALSRDLGIPLQEILDDLPPARSATSQPFLREGAPVRPGQANTYEDVI